MRYKISIYDKDGKMIVEEEREARDKIHAITQSLHSVEAWRFDENPVILRFVIEGKQE